MSTQPAPRIRLGALALGISSLLFLVIALIHPFVDPALNVSPAATPDEAAKAFSSPAFALSDRLHILAFPLFIFGMLALYA
jgi:hypothetical protein